MTCHTPVKDISIRVLDERNARCRALFYERFYSAAQCCDAWPLIGRIYTDLRLEHQRRLARAWMRGARQFQAPIAIEARGTVLPFILRKRGIAI